MLSGHTRVQPEGKLNFKLSAVGFQYPVVFCRLFFTKEKSTKS